MRPLEQNNWDVVYDLEQLFVGFESFKKEVLEGPDIPGVEFISKDEEDNVAYWIQTKEHEYQRVESSFQVALQNRLNRIIENSCHIFRRIRNSTPKEDLDSHIHNICAELDMLFGAFQIHSTAKHYPAILLSIEVIKDSICINERATVKKLVHQRLLHPNSLTVQRLCLKMSCSVPSQM
jgi:hypothetical protein